MNKFCFSIFVALLYVNIFSSCSHVNIPEPNKLLAKGFLDGSGLKIYLNLTSCEKEFYEFLIDSLDVFDSLSKNNNKAEIFKNIGTSFILYSDLINSCKGTKEKFNEIGNYMREAFNNPQKFLVGVMDNAVSFHVIKLYWGLTGKVKEGKFYEVGNIIGDMIKYIVDVKLDRIELSFLSEIDGGNELRNLGTGCIELVYDFLYELFYESKNIFYRNGGDGLSIDELILSIYRILEFISKLGKTCIRL